MTEKVSISDPVDHPASTTDLTLRQRAEEFAHAKTDPVPKNLAMLSPELARQMIHELHIHQIELEMQNEELRRTQLELERSRARYFDLYNLAPVGYLTLSELGLIWEANLTAAGLLGVARQGLVKQPLSRFILPADQDIYYQNRRLLFETGTPRTWEMRLICADGTHFWARIEATAVQESELNVPVCRAIVSDITAHKIAEAALQESEARFRQVWETTSDAMVLSDAEGITLAANPAYLRLYGYTAEQLIGQSFAIIFPEENRAWAVEWYKDIFAPTHTPITFDALIRCADGIERIVEAHATFLTTAGQPTKMLSTIRDITARKRAEERLRESYQGLEVTLAELRQAQAQLIQQERLAAVGQLAAGIAHDFNNILAIIVLHAQICLLTPDLAPRLRERLTTVWEQTGRAVDLIQQILDFGRRAVFEIHPLDLVPFLNDQVNLLRRTLPEQIRIDLSCALDMCIIQADPTRTRQMLTNLVLNARDAMPHGGELAITLDQIWLACDEVAPLPEMEAGPWIKVMVSDTGTGMSPVVLQHLFEPFFTTKEPGKGTGLGLAQVYGIVKQHNGHIAVQTQEGAGSTFTLYLPALGAILPRMSPVTIADPPRGQGETVLVVEDNVSLREAVLSTLELLNYRGLAAANGRAALAILERQASEIAMVLSDLVMPVMDGQALLQALRQRGLTLPMVIMSGHPLETELQTLQAQGLSSWLLKPVDIQQLASILAHTLQNNGK